MRKFEITVDDGDFKTGIESIKDLSDGRITGSDIDILEIMLAEAFLFENRIFNVKEL